MLFLSQITSVWTTGSSQGQGQGAEGEEGPLWCTSFIIWRQISTPHRVTHVHGKQPSARKKAGRGQSCQPPGPKALLVACVFPPVPKSEDLVVIRRHLSGVGWGVQPRSKHWTCELQPTRCGLREAACGLLTENASQGSGSELEEAKWVWVGVFEAERLQVAAAHRCCFEQGRWYPWVWCS